MRKNGFQRIINNKIMVKYNFSIFIILYEYLCAYINIYKNHNKIFLAQFLSIIFALLIEFSKIFWFIFQAQTKIL